MACCSGCTILRRRLNHASAQTAQTPLPSPSTHQRVLWTSASKSLACAACRVPACNPASTDDREPQVMAIRISIHRLIDPNTITSRMLMGSLANIPTMNS